jgi:hypothetical protein
MKHLKTYELYLNESELRTKTETRVIKLDMQSPGLSAIGRIEDEFTLAFSSDSRGIYSLGADVEKFFGVPEADVIRNVKAGKETPDDAIIYGGSSVMNGGADVYLWTNGTRLAGAAKANGIWPAVMEQLSHECVHLARLVLTRAIAKKQGISITNDDWINHDWGHGKTIWPAIGDPSPKTPKIVSIDEEAFATVEGLLVQATIQPFLEMASYYVPQLSAASKI